MMSEERNDQVKLTIITQAAIDSFRGGRDWNGLEYLTQLMTLLEHAVIKQEEKQRIFPILESVLTALRAKDLTAMTDLLEYSLYPELKSIQEGAGTDEDCITA